MRYVQIVFSPTGGTLKAAKAVTEEWNESVDMIDITNRNINFSACSFDSTDIVLIAIPSYGGRVPAIAAERLGKINGGGAKCALLCVYGNRAYEDTLVEMEDIAANCDFEVTAAIAAVAEHSIVNRYASGRPDREDLKKLKEFSQTMLGKLKGKDDTKSAKLKLPGNCPYKKISAARLVPGSDQYCVKCGLCAEKCPVGAISKENIATADSQKCISCMRCTAVCPHGARKANKAVVSAISLALKKSCSERKECELFI